MQGVAQVTVGTFVRARPLAEIAGGTSGIELDDDRLQWVIHDMAIALDIEVLPDGIPAASRLWRKVEETLGRQNRYSGQFDFAGRYVGNRKNLMIGWGSYPAAIDQNMHGRSSNFQRRDDVITRLFLMQLVVEQNLPIGIKCAAQNNDAVA